jgi:hypothetical protein
VRGEEEDYSCLSLGCSRTFLFLRWREPSYGLIHPAAVDCAGRLNALTKSRLVSQEVGLWKCATELFCHVFVEICLIISLRKSVILSAVSVSELRPAFRVAVRPCARELTACL